MSITTRESLEQAIIAWVQFVINPTGTLPANRVPVIMGNGKGPRPNKNYISVMLTANPMIGQVHNSDVVLTEVDEVTIGTQTLTWQYEASVSIQGYGYGIENSLEALRQSPDYITVADKLSTLGIVIRRTGDVTDIPEVVDEQNENRWLFECTIGYAVTGTQQPGWIEDLTYSGTYNPPA